VSSPDREIESGSELRIRLHNIAIGLDFVFVALLDRADRPIVRRHTLDYPA